MITEIIVTGKTIDTALANAASQLGIDKDSVSYEVLELPKKGFMGIGASDAKIKVKIETEDPSSPKKLAISFVQKLIENMRINAEVVVVSETEEELNLTVTGESLGLLIGHHGEILDSIQYLANLAANKSDDGYIKVSIDIENYRAKREETLKTLARRVAEKVLKYKRNITLEPMNSYERRIIHSEIQDIAGVVTYSVGSDNERKVVVALEGNKGGGRAPSAPRGGTSGSPRQGGGEHRQGSGRPSAPRATQPVDKD
ncbi:MAG: RNA-binding cell elongation regulator Jag/EloR [Eubacteriales bacterium]